MTKADMSVLKLFSEMQRGISIPNKYRMEFNLPKGVPNTGRITNDQSEQGRIRQSQSLYNGTGAINIMCHSAMFPDRMLQSYEHKQMVMPYRVPYSQMYNPVTMTFYADSTLNTRRYFDIWQNAVVNIHDNTLNFYSEFTSDVHIWALDREGNDAYGVKLIEAYPLTLASVDLSYGNNAVQNVTVTFSYKYWATLDDNRGEARTIVEKPYGKR
jgi:T4-like virus tail tube protein gp19|nr:MAG TPA: Baseplate wedge protein [Caudoviricetes sp.]DAO72641.1 MAG TPA: Baseplate wedge protein [Caudoviricetes sp.]DAS48656.1 MAG TPA: Baseplate wedge protein [Caudoviricetes sp.]